jgi:hypothetical protein
VQLLAIEAQASFLQMHVSSLPDRLQNGGQCGVRADGLAQTASKARL